MAVTLSIIELLDAIRVGHSDAEMAQGSRLRDYASLAVIKQAPNAPDVVHDEGGHSPCRISLRQGFWSGGRWLCERWAEQWCVVNSRGLSRS